MTTTTKDLRAQLITLVASRDLATLKNLLKSATDWRERQLIELAIRHASN